MPKWNKMSILPIFLGFLLLFPSTSGATASSDDLSIISVCGPADHDPGDDELLKKLLNNEEMGASISLSTNSFQPIYRKEHVAGLTEVGDKVKISLIENGTALPSRLRCALRLESCPSCVFQIEHALPQQYLDREDIERLASCTDTPDEPCLDVRFVEDKVDLSFESVYSTRSLMQYFDEDSIVSTSQMIRILVNLRNIQEDSALGRYVQALFPFTVSVISNEVHIVGESSEHLQYRNQSSIGFIESPRYPSAYPPILEKTYILVNKNPNGHIRLIFDDFHTHYQSELRIEDSDGMEIFNTRRDNRRPTATVSKGNKLRIQFIAHDFTQLVGFRARYEFVDVQNWPERPNARDCDEYFENYGGAITLLGKNHLQNTYIDCIWIVGRMPFGSQKFNQLYVKVEDFSIKGVSLRLEIREGPSSTSDRVLLLLESQTRSQLERKQPRHGFASSLETPSFYIRLKGYLMNSNGLEIVYSQFYQWPTPLCPGAGEWHCDNARCIKGSFRCDGIDHCGDGSDEFCQRLDPTEFANHPDISGLIALLIGAVGLVILLISSTAIVTRCYRKKLLSRMRSATSNTGSEYPPEVAPSMQTVGERRFYVVPEQNISVIEAPPCYDDALKHPMVPTQRSSAYTNIGFSGEQLPLCTTISNANRVETGETTYSQPPQPPSTSPDEPGPSALNSQGSPDHDVNLTMGSSESKNSFTEDSKDKENETPGSWV